MQNVMVVGAAGVLGKLVCMELLRIFNNQINLTVTDYKTDRGRRLAESLGENAAFRYLDVTNEEIIAEAVTNIDIVVVALHQQHPIIQKTCIANRILCIDVTPFSGFVATIKEFHQDAVRNEVGSIVMSGFIPGLSGLMVKKAVSDFHKITEIHIGLLQNTNAKAGLTGILDMLTIISKPVPYDPDYKTAGLPGFRKKRMMSFYGPFPEREVRLIEHAEKEFLQRFLKIENIHYWTSWNSRFFNKLISLIKRIGVMNVILQGNNGKFLSKAIKHNPLKKEDAYLTVEVKGIIGQNEIIKTVSLSACSDYHTTAMVTAALAKVAIHKKITGVVFPFEITDIDEILSEINSKDIALTES